MYRILLVFFGLVLIVSSCSEEIKSNFKVSYYANGSPKDSVELVNGKKHGKAFRFDTLGDIIGEYHFDSNHLVGCNKKFLNKKIISLFSSDHKETFYVERFDKKEQLIDTEGYLVCPTLVLLNTNPEYTNYLDTNWIRVYRACSSLGDVGTKLMGIQILEKEEHQFWDEYKIIFDKYGDVKLMVIGYLKGQGISDTIPVNINVDRR